MPEDEKRGAGRVPKGREPDPRKTDRKSDSDDPRIGQEVADDRWRQITFSDGSSYRVEDGHIVEKLS